MGEKLLLDTHTLIWWTQMPAELSDGALAAIQASDNQVFFSPVSAMEIATKVRIGKLEIARPLAANFASQMREEGFDELPLVSAHAEVAGGLTIANRDPWDRLLLAQAQIERLTLVTGDSRMGGTQATLLW